MNTYPLISCICIANGKPAFFNKALECFQQQNYPNKELVVAYHKQDHYTPALLEKVIKNDDLKIIGLSYCLNQSQEDIARHAIIKSTGHYTCTWNEEDWHHESRLSYQYNSMQIVGERFQASMLSQVRMHDYHTRETYLSVSSLWPETLLCRRDTLLNGYENENLQLQQSDLVKSLLSKKRLHTITNAPFLYVKAFHNEAVAAKLDEKTNEEVIALVH